MAAGLTIEPGKIELLRARLNELARRTLTPESLRPTLKLDGEVQLPELALGRLRELEELEPLGPGNPSVQLFSRKLKHRRPPQRLGKEQRHLKMWVTDGQAVHEAVWWNGAQKAWPDGEFDLAFTPQRNQFQGRETVQLKVLDWRSAS